jgi:hypothetical protein
MEDLRFWYFLTVSQSVHKISLKILKQALDATLKNQLRIGVPKVSFFIYTLSLGSFFSLNKSLADAYHEAI